MKQSAAGLRGIEEKYAGLVRHSIVRRVALGNYFGAMKQHIEDQERHECFFFIANYHSLNTIQDAELLRKKN